MNLLYSGVFKPSEETIRYLNNIFKNIYNIKNEWDELPINVKESRIDAIICNNFFGYHDFREFTTLKFIQLTSVGLDRLPEELLKTNIKIYTARGVYSIPIAEWIVLKILQIYKKSDLFTKYQSRKEWIKERMINELYNKNVLIVGFGDIGKETAKRLIPFGVNISIYDKVSINNEYYNHYGEDKSSMFKEQDIVILTLPLTRETEYFIDNRSLSFMKEGSLLINVSRGLLIKEKDLLSFLQRKKIFAALDVFENEPLPSTSKLWDMENLYLTPHNSFVCEGNSERMNKCVLQNLHEWFGLLK